MVLKYRRMKIIEYQKCALVFFFCVHHLIFTINVAFWVYIDSSNLLNAVQLLTSSCHCFLCLPYLFVVLVVVLMTATVLSFPVSGWKTPQTHFYMHVLFFGDSVYVVYLLLKESIIRVEMELLNCSHRWFLTDWPYLISKLLGLSDHLTFLSNKSPGLK